MNENNQPIKIEKEMAQQEKAGEAPEEKREETIEEGLEIGSVIDDKYRVIAKVGKGGMSIVWLALYEKVNKQWAVKEVRKAGKKDHDVIRQNLITEADILKKLNHPNLPSIVDIIDKKETYLIIMDYVEGQTLKDILDDHGPQTQDDVVQWAIQLCSVLDYLHHRQPAIIYRDLKPANVMLRPDGRVVLIDFGTAREYKEGQDEDTTHLGTKGYAAPEQYGGDHAAQTDARTDIYNLGATMYHLVTGKNPTKPPYEMKPIRQWDPSLSTGLERIILKCIEFDPDKRYQSAKELQYALLHYRELETSYIAKKKNSIRIFLGTLALSLLFFGGGLLLREQANDLLIGTYEEQIKIAQTTLDKAEQKQAYQEAIRIDPSRVSAYEALLTQVYLSDGTLTQKESTELAEVLGHKGARGDITSEQILMSRPADYDAFAYEMGLAYFYYYEGDGNKALSRHWFGIAKDSPHLSPAKRERADRFYKIAKAHATMNQINKAGDSNVNYESYWQDFLAISTGDIAKEDNLRTALVVYKEFASQINQHAASFKGTGITKEALADELYVIQSKVKTLKNEHPDAKEAANEHLIEAIEQNIDHARKTLDIVYQEIGGAQ